MANRFWIGGTGNTSDTAHWSATSGGGGGVSVPVAGDVVAFDTNSGTGTVTDNAGLTCASITHTQPSLTVTASAAQTVTGAVTISAGTWITGAFTHSYGSFASTSGTRTLTLTNSTINITGTTNNLSIWNIATAGSLTITTTGLTVNVTGAISTSNVNFIVGNEAYPAINITSASFNTINFQGNSLTPGTITTLNVTGPASKTGNVITFNRNWTITNLTLAGNSAVNRLFVTSSTLGTTRTLTVTTPTISNLDVQDIAAAGSTPWTGTSLGDCLGNSGITFDASVSLTLASTGTINWSSATWTSSGAARTAPLPQDDVSLGSSSTATTLTADMPRLGRNIDSSGYLKTLSFASTPNTIFGNITLGASATYSATQTLTLQGRGAQTITSNGKTLPQTSIIIDAVTGTYALQDALTITNTLSLSSGTFDDNNFNVSFFTFNSVGATARTVKGSGQWTINGNTSTRWSVTASLTIVKTSTWAILLAGTNSTSVTFAGAGLSYGILFWSSQLSSGTLIITGANTFAALQSDNTTARTWQLPASTITTVKPGGFLIAGKPGTQNITVNSSSAGTQATLSMPWGGITNVNYLTLKDINMTGGARWYVGAGSASTSNNTGMKFKQAGTGRYGSRTIAA